MAADPDCIYVAQILRGKFFRGTVILVRILAEGIGESGGTQPFVILNMSIAEVEIGGAGVISGWQVLSNIALEKPSAGVPLVFICHEPIFSPRPSAALPPRQSAHPDG